MVKSCLDVLDLGLVDTMDLDFYFQCGSAKYTTCSLLCTIMWVGYVCKHSTRKLSLKINTSDIETRT